MATYSFTIKKGKYQLSLVTTDKQLLSEQFESWVREAGEYVQQKKVREHKNTINTQIREEEEITKKNIETQINKSGHEIIEHKEEVLTETEQKSSDKDLDIFYATPSEESDSVEPKKENEATEAQNTNGVFDSILNNSINNPQTELSFRQSPSIKKDNAFINFIGDKKIEKKIDYLLLTAYYFSQYEQKPRFTLKQLNSKLMQNLAVIIDHSVLQEAIHRDYIECLPDLTGLVGASEYRLTAYGEKTILDA